LALEQHGQGPAFSGRLEQDQLALEVATDLIIFFAKLDGTRGIDPAAIDLAIDEA
jgi:hypothetical protein